MTIEIDKLQSYRYMLEDVIQEHIDDNPSFYAENPDRLAGLQKAAMAIFAATLVMPDLLIALKTVRRNGDNALTADTKNLMDVAIARVEGAA